MPIRQLFLFLCLALIVPHAAVKSAPSTAPLDQTLVKKFYNDGDFDPAIALLEDFQKTHTSFSRSDSLMVYKYLGVMYCADQDTREKGKTYFYKLLTIDKKAKILDLYVSIVVQEIFKTTLDELMVGIEDNPGEKKDVARVPDAKPDTAAFATPKPEPKAPAAVAKTPISRPAEKPVAAAPVAPPVKPASDNSTALSGSNGHPALWWISGLALAAGAAGGYYVYAAEPKHKEVDINVDPSK